MIAGLTAQAEGVNGAISSAAAAAGNIAAGSNALTEGLNNAAGGAAALSGAINGDIKMARTV